MPFDISCLTFSHTYQPPLHLLISFNKFLWTLEYCFNTILFPIFDSYNVLVKLLVKITFNNYVLHNTDLHYLSLCNAPNCLAFPPSQTLSKSLGQYLYLLHRNWNLAKLGLRMCYYTKYQTELLNIWFASGLAIHRFF